MYVLEKCFVENCIHNKPKLLRVFFYSDHEHDRSFMRRFAFTSHSMVKFKKFQKFSFGSAQREKLRVDEV